MFLKNVLLVLLTSLLLGCFDSDESPEGGENQSPVIEIFKLEVNLQYDSELAPAEISFSPMGDSCQSESTYCFEYPSGTEISLAAEFSDPAIAISHWSLQTCQKEPSCEIQLVENTVITLFTSTEDQDRDNDGVVDIYDAFPEDPLETVDTDNDGIGDNSDLDRDGDGTPDTLDNDIDGDGIENEHDLFPGDASESSDLDSDGIGDNSDDDIDGDGFSNEVEQQQGTNIADANSQPADIDGDKIPDSLDGDRDGDGVNNEQDDLPNDPLETVDSDGDGIGDNSDTDRDGDGISNQYEKQLGTDPDDSAQAPADLDADGIPDVLDEDIDGDGIENSQDSFPDDASESSDLDSDGIGDNSDDDIDGDGFSNEVEQQQGTNITDANSQPADIDDDKIPDSLDGDRDGDGVNNEQDDLPNDPLETVDSDGDGVGNNQDELPNDPLETVDSDGDGIGDNSDTDRDGDGYLNDMEVHAGSDPNDATSIPADLDKDFIPDSLDQDRDGDGISNEYEEQLGTDPDDRILTPADLDTDGIPDALDEDIDGDGIVNNQDSFPDNANESSDLDGDGIGDNSDDDIDGDGFSNEVELQLGTSTTDAESRPADQDGDKIPDSLDGDRDGDGVANIEDDFPDDKDQFFLQAKINIESPINGFVTSTASVVVSGSIEGPVNQIRIEDQIAVIENDRFTATVTLREGANKITAVGQYQSLTGLRATNATKNVILDTTAPEIIISSITEGMVTTSPDITVAGSLDDLRSNLSENQEPIVTVNGLAVEVIDRSFELSDYSLRPGLNIINVQATDPLGNSKVVQRNVIYLKQAGQKIIELGGNNQSGQVIDMLVEPLSVKLLDRNNLPIANRAATFKVSEGDGSIVSGNSIDRTMTLLSNDQGIIQANYKLGKRSGAGNHQVTVSAIGFPGQVIFSASAQPLMPANLSSARGSAQTGMMGSLLPEPLIARVTDSNGNPLQGVDVLFKVEQGGGNFLDAEGTSSEEIIVSSDFDGNTIQEFVLGAAIKDLGYNSQVITAQVVGQPELMTTFIANNLRSQAIENTQITGIVLDNSNKPLPDVEVKIKGNAFNTRETITDRQGKFIFEQAPVGTVHLVLDGSTTSRDGEWPHLMFEMVTISGQENTVGMPIYFPKVDYDGGKIAGGDKDVIIPMRSVAGAEIIIPANSMTFPDGRKTGRVMFTQVQTDKVPMPAPNGSVFDLAWTVQPSGIHFDPPARVSLPNTFSGAPGEELDMFSFDHDLMEWVSIGPGVVSDDGSKITSRLGHGIRHSGWGGAPPPPDEKCNIKCKSTDECVSKSKNANSCSCKSENLDGKVKKNQKPDDCKTLKCGGDEDNDGETPKDTTGEGDCQTTKCKGGSPSSEDDDSDLPDPKKDNNNKCKTCEGGEVVADKSKDDIFKCSNKKDQECFVCKDGSCQRPDCETSAEKETSSYSAVNIPIYQALAELFDTVSMANPQLNISLNNIRGKYVIETGEKCCNCSTGEVKPEPYKKHSGNIGAGVEFTAAPLGVALKTPPRKFGLGLQVSAVLEIGALIVRGGGKVSGEVSGEESSCDDAEKCIEGKISTNIPMFLGSSVKVEGEAESCDLSYEKCDKLLMLGGQVDIGAQTSLDGNVSGAFGDSCPGLCGSLGFGEAKGVVNMELKVMVANVWEYTYQINKEVKLLDAANVNACF